MNSCVPDEPTVQRLVAVIEASAPRPHHAGLLEGARKLLPECAFRFALTRGGWYRVGGVLRPDGERIADDVERWVTQQLAEVGNDLGEFFERHRDAGLLVTRHSGRTHYFVAPFGTDAAEFLQLEVEESQEVLDRRLWAADTPPVDTLELTDPVHPAVVPAQAVAPSRYRFRRLTDMRRVLARLAAPPGEQPALVRFMAEWMRGRAAADTHFCAHWVIATREHHDRYGNVVTHATPVAPRAHPLKSFHWDAGLSGLDAARQLRAFDRAAGYPGAWYFHLVAGGLVPRALADRLARDLDAGYGYLSDTEGALLVGWLRAPYSV